MNSSHPVLVWFRNDLRLQDHEPLTQALNLGTPLIPVYCFDPRQWGQTSYGFPKTGCFRTQFLLESVATLRQACRDLGSDLVIRVGQPEVVIPELAAAFAVQAIYYHAEITAEELRVERRLQAALVKNPSIAQRDIHLQGFWGSTLYHPQDLPFAIAELPDLFTRFRQAVENQVPIRPLLPRPASLPPLPLGLDDPGALPTLAALGVLEPMRDPLQTFQFVGGEAAAQSRVEDYFWVQDRLRVYKETRNGLLNPNDSSKLSPWLALGCLSPRWVAQQVRAYEAERVANASTYWLIFELLWRDYFRFVCGKYCDRIFSAGGLQGLAIPWSQDRDWFRRWQQGQTGFPLVDASMRELLRTGFMSNRGRQNVASFLTKNLGLHWHLGAEWFESQLVDYDVCSNWGNWNYVAGVGNDARGFRFFNILKQSQDYDPQGEYVKHWLPELAHLPASKVHQPWRLLAVEQKRFGVQLGVDYPFPIVDLLQSAATQEAIYKQARRQQ